MQHPALPTAQNLAYAGLIPFVLPAFLVWVLPEAFAWQATAIFKSYAVVILAFMAGLLWYGALFNDQENTRARAHAWQGISFALLAWAAHWAPLGYGLPLLLVLFWLLRHAEMRLSDVRYPLWFIETRDWLTRIVIASHVSVWVFVLQA